MKAWQRRLSWGLGALLLVTLALIVADSYIPTTVAFGTEDLIARSHYEQIVAAHGYDFRYDKNVRGETYVVIDRITPNAYRRIECEYSAWDAQRQRAQGVTVLDEVACAF
jgi:hypothetical protein